MRQTYLNSLSRKIEPGNANPGIPSRPKTTPKQEETSPPATNCGERPCPKSLRCRLVKCPLERRIVAALSHRFQAGASP
eukprot:160501-Amphidinium_carterae.1